MSKTFTETTQLELCFGGFKASVFADPRWIEFKVDDPEGYALTLSFDVDEAIEIRDWLNSVIPAVRVDEA